MHVLDLQIFGGIIWLIKSHLGLAIIWGLPHQSSSWVIHLMSQSLLGCLSQSTSLILRRTTLFLRTLSCYCCAFYICLLTPIFLWSSWLFTKLYIFPGCHCFCCIAENVAMPMVVPMFSDSQCMNVKELPWIYFRYMKQYFSLFLISQRLCISTVEPLLLVRLLSPPGLQYLPTAKLPSMLILWSPCQIFSDSLLSDCFLWSLLLRPVSSEIEIFRKAPTMHFRTESIREANQSL